ncbi:terminal protein [Curtobacterium phage Ayka]|nr:terminal protein [Curtobacterium phage Ayka]
MSDINELRRQVRMRQQAANRKAKRIQNAGVNIAGTPYDPRRENAPIDKMRSRDLQTYLKQLNGFMSRKTQFVPDTWGRPIHAQKWRAYKRAETRANRKAENMADMLKHYTMPGSDVTLAERHAYAKDTEFPNTANHTVNSPLRKVSRMPSSIASEKALARLTKQQQGKVDPQFFEMTVKRGRIEATKMLKKLGDTEQIKALKGLTDKQFHILWSYTPYSDNTSIRYENGKVEDRGRAEDQMDNTETEVAKSWLRWAKKL